MAEGAAPAVKAAPGTARRGPAPAGVVRRVLSQPGEAAERSARSRAARAVTGGSPAHSRSPRTRQYLPPDTPPEIAGQAGHGRPLPAARAADLGSLLGADFGHVRVHDDHIAAALAEAAMARAFTVGSHVFFNRGEYRPDTGAGRVLLAHELAHVAEAQPGPARLLRQPKPDDGAGSDQSVEPSRRPPPGPAGPADPQVNTGTMLSLALDRLSDLTDQAPGLRILEQELKRLLDLPIDPHQEQLRTRVQHLFEVLASAAPAIQSLGQMRQPDHFPAGIAPAIVGEATRITNLYAVAILMSFAEHESEPPPLDRAESAMQAFPDFLSDQFLGPQGIKALLDNVSTEWAKIERCRGVTGRAPVSRRLDVLLEAGNPRGKRISDDLQRALRNATRSRDRHEPDAFRQITELTEDTQMALAAVSALAYYEQFSAWEKHLSDHWIIDSVHSRLPDARRGRERFEAVVALFETYDRNTPLATRQQVIRTAMEALQHAVQDPETNREWERIQERLETITFIQRTATVALITAAAALTGGLAAAAVEPALALAGAGELAAGGGAFVAEVLTFTAVSRAGQTLAFGDVTTSWSSDLFWNAVTFGAVKGVGRAFARSMEGASGARKIMIGVGRTATTGLVLHTIAEGQAIVQSGGTPMSGEERYRAVVQNILMLAGFELGGFLVEPLQERLGVAIAERFTKPFGDVVAGLEIERGHLSSQLEQMHPATAAAHEVNALLDRVDQVMRREMQLLNLAGRRGIMTTGEIDHALAGYQAAISRLQLRFAQLNIPPPTGGRTPLFRPVSRGVVAFGPEGRTAIEDLGKAPGATLHELAEGALRLQTAAGEVTYFLPEGLTSERLPSYAAAAAGHDAAAVVARDDAVAAEGLRRLGNRQTGFSRLNVSAILAQVRAGAMSDFLTAMADPRFVRTLGVSFMQFLAENPAALAFALRAGPRAMINIRTEAGEGWRSVVDRADRLLDAPPDGTRPDTIAVRLATARNLRAIEDVLGTARPPREPRPPRAFTGARRADRAWPGYLEQARRDAARHGESLSDSQLDLRATMLQLLADGRTTRMRTASHAARLQALDAYDAMGRRSGALTTWINQARGDLAEWLFGPARRLPRRYFLNGIDQGRAVYGVSILDYFESTTETRPDGQPAVEWVELKSDLLDRGSAVSIARRYLKDGRADLANLPRGDRLSIHFVRDPGKAARDAMLKVLRGPDSPFVRVKFGTTWYSPG